MMRHLNELQPTVIHFSGHGGGSAGIYLHDEHRPRPVHRGVDAVAASRLQLEDEQRQPPPTRRDVGAITDAGIYLQDEHRQQQHVSALGYRRSVGNAVAQAVAALAAKQLPDEHLPVCRTRDGISADQVILPNLDPRRPPGTS